MIELLKVANDEILKLKEVVHVYEVKNDSAIVWLERYNINQQPPELRDWVVRQALHVLKGEEEEP